MIPTPRMKIEQINSIAGQQGWQSRICDEPNGRTIVAAIRNDEALAIEWVDESFTAAKYFIFDRLLVLTDLKAVGGIVRGWPDLLDLFKWFPNENRPNLTETYRKLPFALDDPNEEIMAKLVGHKVFWWDAVEAKPRVDVVMPAKGTKKNQYRIVDIGHRKLLHFNGARDGFKSLMLDAILKVG